MPRHEISPTSPAFHLLWGKAGKGAGSDAMERSHWHPLVCHMLDVAAVAEALCDGRLPQALVRRLERLCGGQVGWLVFVVALHDLGKATPAFQVLWPECRVWLEPEYSFDKVCKVPHGTAGYRLVRDALVGRGVDWDAAHGLAQAVCAHHGSFATSIALDRADSPRVQGAGRWDEAREDLVKGIAGLLSLDGAPPTRGAFIHADQLLIAGLTSVADWIGSNADCFVYQPLPVDCDAYFQDARVRAQGALDRAGFRRLTPTPVRTFGQLFPPHAPRRLQIAVGEVVAAIAEAPALLIIESPMGEGKTEAALYAAELLAARFGTQGLFVGLPTQATANQMLTRLAEFLQRTNTTAGAELHLVHGNAALSDSYEELKLNDIWGQSAGATVAASEWFTRSKRALLASNSVGTADQALLGVLNVRHAFVRLFGLAGKTVILDEVHAYDTYTSTLLATLVAWLGAMGANVIILSATLPAARRGELVSAFSGRGVAEAVAYPRITWCAGDTARAMRTLPHRPGTRVRIEKLPGDLTIIAKRLWERLDKGGTAAWICNTVRRAQQAYEAVQQWRPATQQEAKIDMLHARYPHGVRSEREQRICAAYGKGTTHRPACGIVIGTQVLEQSLDLDFDYMVSDIAPVDLVIQRMGRLHRHDRGPRPTGQDAIMGVAMPDGDGLDFSQLAGVYDEEVMLRSWLVLQRDEINLPDDLELLVESVYGEDAPTIPDEWRGKLEDAAANRKNEYQRHKQTARLATLSMPHEADDSFPFDKPAQLEDSPEAHRSLQARTRLGDPSVDVICLFQGEDDDVCIPHGERLDLSVVPGRDLAKLLLGWAVRVSSRGLVQLLTEDGQQPASWQQSSFLARHRLVVFHGGCAIVGKWLLTLDDELGLCIEREVVTK